MRWVVVPGTPINLESNLIFESFANFLFLYLAASTVSIAAARRDMRTSFDMAGKTSIRAKTVGI
jgi:hypothetical protein